MCKINKKQSKFSLIIFPTLTRKNYLQQPGNIDINQFCYIYRKIYIYIYTYKIKILVLYQIAVKRNA